MNEYHLYAHDNGIGFNKLGREDLGLLLQLKNESWRTTHHISILNMCNQIEWFERLLAEDIHCPRNLVLIASAQLHVNDTKVGLFKVHDIDWVSRKANVAWDIFPCCRRKGFGDKMVEAGAWFCKDVLGLRKLTAEILTNNPASMKCALNAGFAQEGLKKEEVYKEGAYLDSHVMGLFTSRLQSRTASSAPWSKVDTVESSEA